MSQVIIRRKAGQEIPDAYLMLALGACPNAWGISLVQDGKLEMNHGEKITIEDIRSSETDFGDFTLTLVATQGATSLNYVPPFEMVGNDDEEPLVAANIAGDFPGFMKQGSSQPESYHFALYLSEHLGTVFDAFDKSLDKLFDYMTKDGFKDKIKMNTVSHGFVNFAFQNGKAVTIAQGDTAKEFPWGWVSNTFGYSEDKKEEPAPTKRPSLLSKRSTVREKHQANNAVEASGAADAKKTETKIEAPPAETGLPAAPPRSQVRPVILSIDNISIKEVSAPGSYSRKNRRNWAKATLGHIPPNLDQPGVKYNVYTGPTGAILTQKEINKALGLSAAKLPPLINPKAERNPSKDIIDPDKQVSSNPLPIMSPSGRERITKFISDERVQKIIGENGTLVSDPDKVQGHEAKIPEFKQQMGWKDTTDTDCLPYPQLLQIAHNNFNDICVLAWDWKRRALIAEAKLKKLVKQEAPAEEVAPQPEVKAKRPSLLERKRAAA